ncbi:MAG: thioesterase family protein [Desulfobacterales bacterium]|nr:thioesterase family protein [Deltaproteobacteria bacterium]NNK94896.1 thioesterase family protein [Desulfobacterales bacterium]
MNESLKPGLTYSYTCPVSQTKTVPHLDPEAEELQVMPEVFATGYLVGLIELTCIKAVKPYLDWPLEQTVGIHIDMSHLAATPPGLEVTTTIKLIEVEGKKLTFTVKAEDGVDLICKGKHVRFVINKEKFDLKVAEKKNNAKQ